MAEVNDRQSALRWWVVPVFGLLLIALAAAMWLLRGAGSAGPVAIDSGRFTIMGTFARIRIEASAADAGKEALARAMTALDDVDRRLSTYREDSELSQVNRDAAERPVAVSAETLMVLERSLEYSRETDGAFDITVVPLLALWKQAAREGRMPTDDQIAAALRHVGWAKVRLSASPPMVRFVEDGVRLTVDAIAKGHAVDRALDAIRGPGVTAGLVDIGGEVASFGRRWTVGVQDPFAAEAGDALGEEAGWRIGLTDAAVATSGNYRRYVTIGDRKFSHIVDPRTGRPAEKLPSVTVIAPRTIDADALATAVSVLGPQEGLALIERIEGVEALLVAGSKDAPQTLRSSGFARFELAQPEVTP